MPLYDSADAGLPLNDNIRVKTGMNESIKSAEVLIVLKNIFKRGFNVVIVIIHITATLIVCVISLFEKYVFTVVEIIRIPSISIKSDKQLFNRSLSVSEKYFVISLKDTEKTSSADML